MLKSIEIRNFKSLGSDSGDIKIKPITILIGPNSSGKTSYLQMLLMLKQTIESRDYQSSLITNSNYVKLGSYLDFVYNHKASNNINIKIKINLIGSTSYYQRTKVYSNREEDGIKDYFPWFDPKDDFIYDITFNRLANLQINVKSIKIIHKEREMITFQYEGRGGYSFNSKYVPFGNKRDVHKSYRPNNFYSVPRAIMLGKVQHYPSLFRFLYELERSLERVFRQLYYIGPLREYPKRLYVATGERPIDVGLSGEKSIEVMITSKFKSTKDLFKKINYWLKIFNMASQIKLDRLRGSGSFYYLNIYDLYTGDKSNIADVGFGVSQILPLIVETFYCPAGSTLIIEQPEIHLHPKVQSDISDMIIEGSKRINFIIETHSEHLITRIQRRIAEGSIDKNHVGVYFCSKGENGTILKELELTDGGLFVEWPDGLFGDELEDHYQIILSSSNKQKNINLKNKISE